MEKQKCLKMAKNNLKTEIDTIIPIGYTNKEFIQDNCLHINIALHNGYCQCNKCFKVFIIPID